MKLETPTHICRLEDETFHLLFSEQRSKMARLGPTPSLYDKVELTGELDASLTSWQKQANYAGTELLQIAVKNGQLTNAQLIESLDNSNYGTRICRGVVENVITYLQTNASLENSAIAEELELMTAQLGARPATLEYAQEIAQYIKGLNPPLSDEFLSAIPRINLEIPSSLGQFAELARSPASCATLFSEAFNLLLNHHARSGKTLPISKSTLEDLNVWRIKEALISLSEISIADLERQIQKVPPGMISARHLEIRLLANGELLLTTPLEQCAITALENPVSTIRQKVTGPVTLENVIDGNIGYAGIDQCSDWVFGKIDTIEVACKNARVTSAHLNIMAAFPDSIFILNYNPEYWDTRFGIKNFPIYMESEAKRLGIQSAFEFRELDYGSNDEYEGIVWTRDYKLPSPTNQREIGELIPEESRLTYPQGVSIPIDGGGMYPVGRYLFLSNRFFQNLNPPGPKDDCGQRELIETMEYVFGREVIQVGDGSKDSVPPYLGSQHIDLYMLFLPQPGKFRNLTILLPDIKLASDLIKDARLTPSDLQRGYRAASLKGLRLSVLDVAQSNGLTPWDVGLGPVVEDREHFAMKEIAIDAEKRLDQRYFNKLQEHLEERGFTVVRLPFLIPGTDVGGGKFWSESTNQFNGFVEVKKNESVLTIPDYGVQVINHYIIRELNKLGYDVQFLNGIQEFSFESGAHCLTNDTRTAVAGSTLSLSDPDIMQARP